MLLTYQCHMNICFGIASDTFPSLKSIDISCFCIFMKMIVILCLSCVTTLTISLIISIFGHKTTGTVLHKDVLKYHLFWVFSLLFCTWSPATLKKTPLLNATLRLQLDARLCLHVQVFYELMLPGAAFRLQTILISPLYSSWLRERSGTFWHRSSHPRKVGWALGTTLSASQRWAAIHRDWLRTISSAGSEGPWTLLMCRGPPIPLPPPDGQTRTDRRMHGQIDGRTDTGKRHTDPAIDRERYKEGGTTPDSQRERLAFRATERRWINHKDETNFKKK